MIKQAAQTSSFDYLERFFSQHRRKAVMYALLCVIVSIGFSLFLSAGRQPANTGNDSTVTGIRLLCFVVMGIVNSWIFYKGHLFTASLTQETKLAFNSVLFIAISLVLYLVYSLWVNNGLILALADSGSFFLPFLVQQVWLAFNGIPHKIYAAWYLPAAEKMVVPGTFNNMQVQLKVLRRANDTNPHSYPFSASERILLGQAFAIFMAGKTTHGNLSDIQVADNQQQSFGWLFYEEKWGGLYSRGLDASMSLFDNHIKPNAKIRILRTKEPQ